ncbi:MULTISPECIES: hypothetical protein [unclassified Cryobacterium]|uniref:hypothetical protein n=1 Tax=unclassified Cryobacterium TaxID=2649013 RepID=UPI001E2CADFA|nr:MULTISPECIES: hypothetical protein [unclassified Cryobacterium]
MVVVVDDESFEDLVELPEGQGGRGDEGAVGSVRDVPGQVREELGGDGSVEPFDLSASLRDADSGVD